MARTFDVEKLYGARTPEELKAEYDRHAADYERWVLQDFGWRGHEMLADLAASLLGPDAAILDAGAGSGLVGQALAARGFAMIDGLDMSAEMLDLARAKGVYRALAQGVMGEPLDYPADAYDAAIVAGVFTPGHAPPGSLDELIRVVRSGGYILFSLRDDVMPDGFAEKMRALTEAGLWRLVRKGERFQSAPKGEPHVRHRMWVYQVV